MRSYVFYNLIRVNISDDDWEFLCKSRFFSDNPSYEDVRAEFISGTGITPNKPQLWGTADKAFSDYINELKNILHEKREVV